ncbi:hypothetical protein EMGBS15_08260 [Filimonas sp.]|nr:hypothetical protein EMGBS15_08260 [Filimonas sp.]
MIYKLNYSILVNNYNGIRCRLQKSLNLFSALFIFSIVSDLNVYLSFITIVNQTGC